MQRALVHHRDLLWLMVRRHLQLRYKNTLLGYAWSLLHPLAFAVIYIWVFGRVMRIEVPDYPLFLIAGLFPWHWFANATGGALGCFVGQAPLIQRLRFPKSLLVVSASIDEALHFLATVPVILLTLWWFGRGPAWQWLWWGPVLLAVQFVCTTAFSLVTATTNVFFRDIDRIVRLGLLLWFFVSPVLYPVEMIPANFRWTVFCNPPGALAACWRRLFLGEALDLRLLGAATLGSLCDVDDAIVLQGVCKSFPTRRAGAFGLKNWLLRRAHGSGPAERIHALRDVELRVGRGETLGIIGRNGTGKSSLLACLAGVLRPDAGTIEVRGEVSPLLALGAGFHPDLTGFENLRFNGVLLGLTIREVEARADSIAAFSELGDDLQRPIREYSSGMLARLGFSVAIVRRPDVLLIDEVLAVGDHAFAAKCLDAMAELRAAAATTVFVSHNLPVVRRVCTRVAWFDGGRCRQVGDPDTVVDAYLRAPA
ncbi:MAG: ATP-binding cassette domain-containing protein [Planctomycetota bacterium]